MMRRDRSSRSSTASSTRRGGQRNIGSVWKKGDGFVIVRHRDTRVVEAALSTLVQTIRVRYA